MANACNRRCMYCPIHFDDTYINTEKIDEIISYLHKNEEYYDDCTINFFWGEPLLNFENVRYFIEHANNSKLQYSIGTNWILLTEDILNFLIQNNVRIYLTFHADKEETYKQLLKWKFLQKAFHLIQINFIVSPVHINLVYEKIDRVMEFWFLKVNIIPVMLTIPWKQDDLKNLKKFIIYVDKQYIHNETYANAKIYKFSYFDWIPVEIWLVIDSKLNIYQDSSDELFIGKQYDTLWDNLIKQVESATLIGNIQNTSLYEVVKKYDIKTIVKLLYSLPEKLGYLRDYVVIYKIMNSDENNRSNMGWNIYRVLTSKGNDTISK